MDQEDLERCLWADSDGCELWVAQGPKKACQFYVVSGKTGEVMLQWQNESTTAGSVSCVCIYEDLPDGRQRRLLKVAWSGLRAVYCDYVTIGGTQAVLETETLIDVSFDISGFQLIWDHGLALIMEDLLDCLHIFDTGRNRYLGYLTLYSSAEAVLKYDSTHSTLWAIVKQYDESTKVSSACLNTYRLPSFALASSVQLPRGFTYYAFAKKAPGIKHLEQFEELSNVVCSSCDLMDRSVFQWFLSPKMPWREVIQDHAAAPEAPDGLPEPMQSHPQPQSPSQALEKTPTTPLKLIPLKTTSHT